MDPSSIWRSVLETVAETLEVGGVSPDQIEALGLANQGETVVAWDRESGEPLYNAITWQCARTAPRCEVLSAHAVARAIPAKTGLVLDPYFSATKIQWLLENVPAVECALEAGRLLAGTLDSWLIWRMTAGRSFVTDYATASRTMLFNVRTGSPFATKTLRVLRLRRNPKGLVGR